MIKKGDVVRCEVNMMCSTDQVIWEVSGVQGDPLYDEKGFSWADDGFMVKTKKGDFPGSDGDEEEGGWYWMAKDRIIGVV